MASLRERFGDRRGWLWSSLAGVLLAAAVCAGAWFASLVTPLPARLMAEGSTVVQWRDGRTAHVFLAPDERWRIPVRASEVDPDLVDALVRLEDKRFHRHLGVDLIAIARAAFLNVAKSRVVSGGSTLTMQVVRLVEPRPRTLRSKVIEAARAVQLELRLSKSEILAAWLQFTPYGRNIEGIEAAAWSYFGHGADALSPGEIATLLAVPQNPNLRYPRPDHEQRLRTVRDDIAERLLDAGALSLGDATEAASAEVLAEVRREPVPTSLRPMPRSAPHAAEWLIRRGGDWHLATEQGDEAARAFLRVHSTLDYAAQRAVDDRLAHAADELGPSGVRNAAIVVVDRTSREVLALGGNLPGEFVAAFDVPRSPGSALKPFVHAMAIDRGLALPSFLVPDIPATWGSWSPTNYDGRFDGLVRLDDALSRSLNLPYIALLQQVGVEEFLGGLGQMGVRSIGADPGRYGLSAAVGGVELTALELAGLYATLAEDGEYRPLRFEVGEHDDFGRPVFSEGSTWLTRKTLSQRDRPDFPRRRELHQVPDIHWKTGTSSGRRDAWAVGSGPDHTVAVWVGNLDNRGRAQLQGSETAGPILFDVLAALRDRGLPATVDPVPSELRRIDVCAYSGYPPTAACPRRTTEFARYEAVPTTSCPFHVEREVDVANGLAVRPGCAGDAETEHRTFVVWPATVRRFVRHHHRHLPEPPAWAPGCAPPRRDDPPAILHPPADHIALLIPGMPVDKQQIPLEAEAAGDARLSWFVDGVFLATVDATERVWWTPEAGSHEVVVTDERGRVSRRDLEVRRGR